MNDTISDLLVRVSNASSAGKANLSIAYSKVKEGILKVLKEEGYIGDFKTDMDKKSLLVDLSGGKKEFEKIRRVSRPGKRSYIKSKDITRPKGYGIVIVSTPIGVLSGGRAKSAGVGGEIICEVW